MKILDKFFWFDIFVLIKFREIFHFRENNKLICLELGEIL